MTIAPAMEAIDERSVRLQTSSRTMTLRPSTIAMQFTAKLRVQNKYENVESQDDVEAEKGVSIMGRPPFKSLLTRVASY